VVPGARHPAADAVVGQNAGRGPGLPEQRLVALDDARDRDLAGGARRKPARRRRARPAGPKPARFVAARAAARMTRRRPVDRLSAYPVVLSPFATLRVDSAKDL